MFSIKDKRQDKRFTKQISVTRVSWGLGGGGGGGQLYG